MNERQRDEVPELLERMRANPEFLRDLGASIILRCMRWFFYGAMFGTAVTGLLMWMVS